MAKDSGLPAEKATEQAEQAAERYTCRQRVGGLWCRGQAVIQQTLTDARSLLAAVDMAIKTLPEPFLEGSPGWGESLSLSEGQTAQDGVVIADSTQEGALRPDRQSFGLPFVFC